MNLLGVKKRVVARPIVTFFDGGGPYSEGVFLPSMLAARSPSRNASRSRPRAGDVCLSMLSLGSGDLDGLWENP